MTHCFSTTGKLMLIFGLVAFFSIGIFSMSSSTMNLMDGKANCPFGGHSMAICQMNPMEHIQEWQSMFTMLPAQNTLLILFALFAFIAIHKLNTWNELSIPEPPLLYSSSHSWFANNFQIFDPLREAFSNGILNPKIF